MAKIPELVVGFLFNMTRKLNQTYSENMSRTHGVIKALHESQRTGALEVIVDGVGWGGGAGDCVPRYILRFDHQYTP